MANTRKKTSKKPTTKQPVKRAKSGERLLENPKKVWNKPLTWLNHPVVPHYKKLPKARLIFWAACKQLWSNKKLFGGIVVVYGLLNLLLVRGLSEGTDVSALKNTLDGVLHGVGGELTTALTSFSYLLASSGGGSTANAGVYNVVLLTVCSLAVIWSLRQVMLGNAARIRDSFYKGMYPVVPFVLVFLLLMVQLIPLALGGGLYALVSGNGIAINFWERLPFLIIFVLAGIWTVRMIIATIIALYIVTLPDMTPLRAYRSAKQLVYGRRLLILRKLIFLPFILLVLLIVIEVPIILWATKAADWSFFVLSMLVLPFVHGYLYNLYREMI